MELKKQYNELLLRYNKGLKYLEENPDKQEEFTPELEKISISLGDVLNKIKEDQEVTEQEVESGFVIENKEMVIKPQKQNNSMSVFKENWQIASQFAKSALVPETYQNKPENIVIAMSMAQRMNVDMFVVMQNLNIIKGKTSWSASACRMLIENSGKFKNLDLVYTGEKGKETRGCYAQAIRKSDGTLIQGVEVTMAMAKADGWIAKNPKWTSMPELMLGYRALAFFARMHVPEALMGMTTTEEVLDILSEDDKPKGKKIL